MKNEIKRILKDRIENGIKRDGEFNIKRYNAPFSERYYNARYEAGFTTRDLVEKALDYQETFKEDTWEHEECDGLIHWNVEELMKEYNVKITKFEDEEIITFKK